MTSSALARDVLAACQALEESTGGERDEATRLVLESVEALLRPIGFATHQASRGGERVRGDEPAFRVDSSTDYVIHDVRRAAAIARAWSKKASRGLCTPEPLEDDPNGLLRDLLDLELSEAVLASVVDVVRCSQEIRSLTASERRAARGDVEGSVR